ncbi:hypothetical protein BV20DRAFT_966756 [Pilatotrama ljubarskyi]|nr:hypothetical protein BV20DRAFT_966756 [Pilatotrama ljubarskyi]
MYMRRHTLTTISERTEQSEDGRGWEPPPQHLTQPANPYRQSGGSRATLLSSVTTDYGQVIERPSLHPDEVVVSPSDSALHRLSYQESQDAATPASGRTPSSSADTITPQSASAEVPPMENIPDIPDFRSKSSLQRPLAPSQTSLLSKKSQQTTGHTGSEKKSKLSALASSRSSAKSSASSVSTHSYITESASDVTYPALRPSAASMISLIPDKRLPSRPSSMSAMTEQSESSLPSSMSRVVNEALKSALALEALDREAAKEPTNLSIPTSRPLSDITSASSKTASPIPTTIPHARSPHSPPAPSPAPGPESPPSSSSMPHPPSTSPGQPRQLSKLARLAQAKAQEQTQAPKVKALSGSQPGLILPRSHTEYLIPTANGPTATTAITTSYQSLSSLLTKEQSKLPPSMQYPPPPNAKHASLSPRSSEPKQSKLAMKSKSARSKMEPEPEFEPTISPVVEVPIFSPKAIRSRASPSAFASLLIDDDDGSPEAERTHRKHRHHHKHDRDRTRSKERGDTDNPARHKARDIPPLPPAPLPPLRGFAFDVPSPDDIVFNARKGTSLAQRSILSTHSSPSTATTSSR